MPEDKEIAHAQGLILALNEARQKEIAVVRGQIEDFLRGQLGLEHKMDIVSTKQDAMKERFEEGVSKRITGMDGKVDKILIEMGENKKDNQLRDERISDVKILAAGANTKAESAFNEAVFYGRAILGTVLGALVLSGLLFFFGKVHGG